MVGTITVNIDNLQTLVQYLLFIKSTLDEENSLLPSLSAQLQAAIVGTDSNIVAFENQFKGWMNTLSTLTTEMDQAYSTLSAVLEAEIAAAGVI